MSTVKIKIASDILCPWCIIGYKRLEKAISELDLKDKVTLEWIPFELNPNMPKEGQDLQEHLSEKYGTTTEQQEQSQLQISAIAHDLGFSFDFYEGIKMFNTREAHVLLDYAKEKGKQTALNTRFITAHYSEQKDISIQENLLNEVEAIGLDKKEALGRLNNDEAIYKVVQEENYWQKLGVRSTPTFIFEDMSAIQGAQPIEVFKDAILNSIKANPEQ